MGIIDISPSLPIQLCPDYMGIELGIGESLIIKAIAQSTGRKPADIKADLSKIGDLGLVAERSKGRQMTLAKPKPLTVAFVFKTLEDIAKATGANVSSLHLYIQDRGPEPSADRIG